MEWLGVTIIKKDPQRFFIKFMERTIKERREQENVCRLTHKFVKCFRKLTFIGFHRLTCYLDQ